MAMMGLTESEVDEQAFSRNKVRNKKEGLDKYQK